MSNISSENKIFILFSFRDFVRIQLAKFTLVSLCSSVSNGSFCILETRNPRSFLSILRTLIQEIPKRRSVFRDEIGFRRSSRCLIF